MVISHSGNVVAFFHTFPRVFTAFTVLAVLAVLTRLARTARTARTKKAPETNNIPGQDVLIYPFAIVLEVLHLLKHIFGYSAKRAYPVIRKTLKRCSGGNS